jgi:hypothetical protein
MDVAIILISAVLFALVLFITVQGQRARRAAREHEQAEARVTAGKAEAQHEKSLRRQAGARAAHAEGAPKVGTDTDE